MILCKAQFARAIDGAVFPGIQGGPLMHIIAAKAVCFREAARPEFRDYQRRVLENAAALAEILAELGFAVVSGGTDNHLLLLDLRENLPALAGRTAQELLERANITVNKNTIPGETRSPVETSGLRLGTPAVTSRGMGQEELRQIGRWIAEILTASDGEATIAAVREKVLALCARFPLPYGQDS